jgi:glycosyltransferase involved in cell wall biosynthesis
MRILQITPTSFSTASVIGGGERYVDNVAAAARAAGFQNEAEFSVLSVGGENRMSLGSDGSIVHIVRGNPEELNSVDGVEFRRVVDSADCVHVHQCLTRFGLFAAAQAAALGKHVLGTDHGGGEDRLVVRHLAFAELFDAFHAQSEFAALAFVNLRPPTRVIKGPVNDRLFPFSMAPRDPRLVIALGRILPHKGYETIIDALPKALRLVVVGRLYDAGYAQFLRARAAGKDIVFSSDLGDEQLVDLLQRASICVHASTHFTADGSFVHKPELLALAPLEALCTGCPALVSTAGSLRELGDLAGCKVFSDADELRDLLLDHAAGKLFANVDHRLIAGMVRERYGLEQFGNAYARVIKAL